MSAWKRVWSGWLMVVLSAGAAGAANYYISSSAGADANVGSSTQPWKTLGKLSTAGLAVGDTVYLARGDTWYETLNVPVAGTGESTRVTFDAYGAGALPVITANNLIAGATITSGTWVNTSGNIWRMGLGATADPRRLWVDNAEWKRSNSGTAPTADMPWGFSGTYLYVYAASNPATLYGRFECAKLAKALSTTNRDFITVRNLDLRGGYSCAVECYSDFCIFEYCQIGWNAGLKGLLAHGDGQDGNNAYAGIIRYCTFDSNDTLKHTYEVTSAVDDGVRLNYGAWNWEVHHNFFKNWGHTAIYVTGAGGSPAGYVTQNNRIHHNVITAPDIDYGRGFGFDGSEGECVNNYFYYNVIRNVPTRNQVGGQQNTIYCNIIDGVIGVAWRTDDTGQGITLEGYSPYTACHDNQIANNVILNCTAEGIKLWGYAGAGNKQNNRIYNNLITQCGINPRDPVAAGASIWVATHPTVLNNVFQNNLVYSPAKATPIYYRGDGWLNAAGFNVKSASGDVIQSNVQYEPLMVNSGYPATAYGGGDYRPQGGSPLINLATASVIVSPVTPPLIADFDGDGNRWGEPPDIGAYEFLARAVHVMFGLGVFFGINQ